MANNSDRWYFSKEKIRNSPTVLDGVEHAKELGYRQQCANLIQDIGQRLQVNQLVINTAIVYMHRFYMFHSFNVCHRHVMAACFLFLAAKVEEQPRKLEHILKASHVCLNKDEPSLDPKSDEYMRISQELVNNESILLQTLGFEVSVDHPNTFVVKCAQVLKASKELVQTAYFLATNSLHLTTFCIQYKPALVACVCIYVSCLWANYVIPETEGKNWYEVIDNSATKKQLEDLSSYFIKILDSSQTRLKKRLTSGGAVVFKDGKITDKKNSESHHSSSSHGKPNNKTESSNSNTSSSSTKAENSSKSAVSTKTHLTGLLKPHSHEATPPPSRSSSGNNLHLSHHKKPHDNHSKPSQVSSHSQQSRSVKGVTANSDGKLHSKTPHSNHKTPEQLKAEQRKKWTPEQWEEYKKRKEKEKLLYYQKKKAMESNGSSSDKPTFKAPGQVRKSAHDESPMKKQKLESGNSKHVFLDRGLNNSRKLDHGSDLLHRKHKDRTKLKTLSSSGSDSDSSHDSRKHNSALQPLPPPPPPHKLHPMKTVDQKEVRLKSAYSPSKVNGKPILSSPPPPPPPLPTVELKHV